LGLLLPYFKSDLQKNIYQ